MATPVLSAKLDSLLYSKVTTVSAYLTRTEKMLPVLSTRK